jgi:hypothetical protein
LAEEIWAGRDRFGLFDAAQGRRYWFHMCPATDSALSRVRRAMVDSTLVGRRQFLSRIAPPRYA